jgi:TfoX/Sxy family transcriptional regulator of competence genes
MAPEKKKTSIPPDKLRLYEKLVASTPEIDSKSNFGAAYTAINGNMYSLISKYGVVGIRLPEPDRTAFLERYSAQIFRADPAWPPNKEYVAVPDDLLRKTATLRRYLKASYEYAKALRPKATSKKK